MVAIPRKRLTVPLAPLIAGVLAAFVALVVAVLPADLLGRLVLGSGIAAVVPAAEPPLGATARAALILIGGGGIGLVAWFAVFLMIGTRSIVLSGRGDAADAVPVLRRADAHPDAPPRRPLFATQDLGTPFLDVRAPVQDVVEHMATPATLERDLPADLDQPLSAFDPAAIPHTPIAPSAPIAPMAAPGPLPLRRPQMFDERERFETFALTPIVREAEPAPEPAFAATPIRPVAPVRAEFDPSASIHALLDRLEKGVTSRAPSPRVAREESLQESLASLRKLATNR
ncbi:hypothetical protein [Sphingomonas sp. PB4P5]|uniref:hypothetical protein n=1 Tax=Parasphingomonas puruogangriensis TaxID=3096155 RepID=UPI002FC585F5